MKSLQIRLTAFSMFYVLHLLIKSLIHYRKMTNDKRSYKVKVKLSLCLTKYHAINMYTLLN